MATGWSQSRESDPTGVACNHNPKRGAPLRFVTRNHPLAYCAGTAELPIRRSL